MYKRQSIRYRLQGLDGGSTTTSTGNSTPTFNRADKYTASSVDYYTETTDQPYTDCLLYTSRCV